MKYLGVLLVGLGLGIFLAFLTAVLFLGESSPFSIAAIIVGLALIGLGIYTARLEYKSLKNISSSQTAQRAAAIEEKADKLKVADIPIGLWEY